MLETIIILDARKMRYKYNYFVRCVKKKNETVSEERYKEKKIKRKYRSTHVSHGQRPPTVSSTAHLKPPRGVKVVLLERDVQQLRHRLATNNCRRLLLLFNMNIVFL